MENSANAHLQLRKQVYKILKLWHDTGRIGTACHYHDSSYLWWLLRKENWEYFRPGIILTDSEVRTCEWLCGPYGWTIHQMLLAQDERVPFDYV